MKRFRKWKNGVLVESVIDNTPQDAKTFQLAVKIAPGTELKRLLVRLGLTPTPGCKCLQRIREMNRRGVEWCEQNIDTIVEWLREEATRARLPFTSIGAKIVIKRAIRNARKTASR